MTVPAQLPPPIAGFVGRKAETALLEAPTPPVTVLFGPPGVGKTALAVHWARSAGDLFPDGRLHVDLRGFADAEPRDPADALRLLLESLGVEPDRMPADLDGRQALYRGRTASLRLLVILDNARDDDQVRPLLPAGDRTRAVVTSRRRLTGLIAAVGARPIELDVLAEDEAVELFHDRVGGAGSGTAEIVRACGRLPLAVTLAAARVRTSGHPLAALAALHAELRRPANRLEALDDLRAVFSWSYQGLSPAAARLFRLLGLATGPDIALAAASALAGRPVAAVRRLLSELTEAALITEPVPGRFAMTDLIRAYAGELARATDSAADRRAALTRLMDHYTHTAYQADLVLNPSRAPIPMSLGAPADDSRPSPLVD